MTSSPPFTNLIDQEQQVQSRPPVLMHSVRACMSVAPAAFKLLHFFVSLITLVFILYIANEARNNLADAADTLTDVQELVPEVAKSLKILQSVCNAPSWAPYCS